MKKVFLSYRRFESSGYSRLIYEHLDALQPDWRLFMDVRDIEPGSDWRRRLAERIAAADCVLVLIGRDWLTLEDDSGRRRLDDPDDITRWEIEEALRQDKQLVPVLLEGTDNLTDAALPDTLKVLARLQAIELRHETFDADIENLIARLQHRSLRDRLRQSQGMVALDVARRWATPLLAIAAFSLSWLGLLDLLTLDTRAMTWSLAVAETVSESELSDEITLVAIPAGFDTGGDDARTRYASLIERLAAAGAKAVLFDLYFEDARPVDTVLISAMSAAITGGTEVYFGFRALREGSPDAVAALQNAASGTGLICVGGRLGYAQTMPIAFNYRETIDAETGEVETAVDPSPGLAVLGAFGPATVRHLDATGRWLELAVAGDTLHPRFSMLNRIRAPQTNCEALEAESWAAVLFLRLSPLQQLRASDRRFEMLELLDGAVDLTDLRGRIVVVGHESSHDQVQVAYGLRSERRYGYELYADAINTLRRGRVVQPIGLWPEFFIMLGSAAAGAWLGIRLRDATGAVRGAVMASITVVYLFAGIWLIAHANVVLHYTYDLFALVVAYLLFRRRARRLLGESG